MRYFLFGALRANRDVETVLYNWRFGSNQRDTELALLLRAPGRAMLLQEHRLWEAIAAASHDPRLSVDVLPFPTDRQVARAAARCNALILPYLWGSHSGQLELALDLGMLPIASDIGHLTEQVMQHAGLAPQPVWFDWSDGAEYAYGERFLAALDTAYDLLASGWEPPSREAFRDYRRREHERILAGYEVVYQSARFDL